MTHSQQICIATYPDEMSAEVAKTSLVARNIPAFVSKDDCGGMKPNLQMITPIRLMINAADAAEAADILKPIPADPE